MLISTYFEFSSFPPGISLYFHFIVAGKSPHSQGVFCTQHVENILENLKRINARVGSLCVVHWGVYGTVLEPSASSSL